MLTPDESGTTEFPEDLRIRRSRRLLGGALVQLALERPFESITVRELTERAQVGYATFFRHYANKEELLQSLLGDLLEELVATAGPYASLDPASAAPKVFEHAAANAPLYRLLLHTSHATGLLRRAVAVGAAEMAKNYRPRRPSAVPMEIASEHLVRSFVGLIDWWLDNDMPYPPGRMGEIFDTMVRIPLENTALQPRAVDPRE